MIPRAYKKLSCTGLVFFLFLALGACDQDPLNLQYREISNGIYLHQWEDGTTYYVETKYTIGSNGGGFLEGTVTDIGWNKKYLVVKKNPLFQGDPRGWFLINIATRKLDGPIPKTALKNVLETNKIKILSPTAAWDELG